MWFDNCFCYAFSVVLLLTLVNVGRSTAVAYWDESIVLWGTIFEKLSLLEHYGFMRINESELYQVHKDQRIVIKFALNIDHFEWSEDQLPFSVIPFGAHLRLNRILNSEGRALASIWSSLDVNKDGRRMYSFKNEIQSLRATRLVLISLQGSEKIQHNELTQFSQQHIKYNKITIELLIMILSDLSTQSVYHINTLESVLQPYYTHIDEYIMSSITYNTDQYTTKHHVLNLVYAYVRLTLLPFIQSEHSSLIDSVYILYNTTSHYTTDHSVHKYQLLVTEQHHTAINTAPIGISGTSDSSVKVYEAYRLLYSLPMEKDSHSVYNNSMGVSVQNLQRVECISIRYNNTSTTTTTNSVENDVFSTTAPVYTDSTRSAAYCEIDLHTLTDYFRLITSAGLAVYFLPHHTLHTTNRSSSSSSSTYNNYTHYFRSSVDMAPLHSVVGDLAPHALHETLASRQKTIRRRAYLPCRTGTDGSRGNSSGGDGDFAVTHNTNTDTSTNTINTMNTSNNNNATTFTTTDTPLRTLLLGLGAGHYHHYLLHTFPRMTVDSVEIDYNVYSVARSVLQFDVVCRVLNISYAGGVATISTIHTPHDSGGSGSDNYTDSGDRMCTGECRSTVIITDAWQYVRFVRSQLTTTYNTTLNTSHTTHHDNTSHTAALSVPVTSATTTTITASTTSPVTITTPTTATTTTYDMVIVDLFDSTAALWTGQADRGQCNPSTTPHTTLSNLHNVYDILTPCSGVAMVHISRDAYFMQYVHNVREVFGGTQVVVLRAKSMDYVIIARKGALHTNSTDHSGSVDDINETSVCSTTPHPCTNPMQFADWVTQFASEHNFPDVLKYGYRYALDCTEF